MTRTRAAGAAHHRNVISCYFSSGLIGCCVMLLLPRRLGRDIPFHQRRAAGSGGTGRTGILGGAVTGPRFRRRHDGSLWMCILQHPTARLRALELWLGVNRATPVSAHTGGWMINDGPLRTSAHEEPTACYLEPHACPTLKPMTVPTGIQKKALHYGAKGFSFRLISSPLAVALFFLCYSLITRPGTF